jgi:hypothetical protein
VSHAIFQVVYDGPALENHEMDARDLSSALMAMDLLFQEADATLNGGKTETRLVVRGSFRTGSFKIDFASTQALVERFRDMLAGDTTTAVLNAVGIVAIFTSLVKFIKWLRGRKTTRLEFNEGRVRVFVNDEFLDVEKRTIDLFRNHKLRLALQKAIEEPLQKEGVDSFAVIQGETVAVSVTKQEAPFFVVPELELMQLVDRRFDTHLNIVSPSFQGGDKWRVNDGGANFYVSISDQNFTEKLLRDEVVLSASTMLKVRLHEVQYTDPKGTLRKECDIEQVLAVIRPHEQLALPQIEIAPPEQLPPLEH